LDLYQVSVLLQDNVVKVRMMDVESGQFYFNSYS